MSSRFDIMNLTVENMSDKNGLFVRHATAIGFSVMITTLLPLILYVLLFLALDELSDPGGPLMFVLIPVENFILSICLSTLLFLPLFVLLEWLLNKWHFAMKKITRWVAGIFVGFGSFMIFIMFYGLLRNILGDPAFSLTDDEYFSIHLMLFFGSIPILLGGSLYWLALKLPHMIPSAQED